MFRSVNHKQLWSGFIFLALGVVTLFLLPSKIGTAATMGPGYFPMLLALCLILFGATSMVLSIRSAVRVDVEKLPVGTMLLVLGGMLAFGILISQAGLAVSLLSLVLVSCAGRLWRHPFEVLIIYAVLLAMMYVVFIYVLQRPINLFWWE